MLDVLNLLGLGNFDRPQNGSYLDHVDRDLLHEVNITGNQPVWLARPLYGFAAPLIILITLVTNSFVVAVLSNKNLRTPTNAILLSMAITELMTGLSSSPWFLYYYTFGGFKEDIIDGLPRLWCTIHPYFAVSFPTIFHTAAIWLTVYLAIQRYIYVCLPSLVARFCSPKRTKHIIVYICLAACFSEMPQMLTEYGVSVPYFHRRYCFRKDIDLVEQYIGVYTWRAGLLVAKAIFVHILPCVLLIIFTAGLFKTVDRADRKRSVHQMPCRKTVELITVRTSVFQTSGCLSSNRLMHATTRMLVVVIAIFLIIEIPVALIFIIHLLVVYYKFQNPYMYLVVNNLLIVRNFLIILTYPLNFAIYFGMSSSFKLQFRQLFSKKVLYIASPHTDTTAASWRPRFSIQLIDIHKLRRPSHRPNRKKSFERSRMSTSPLEPTGLQDEFV